MKNAMRLADWQATENARHLVALKKELDVFVTERATVDYGFNSGTKREVIIEELRQAHEGLKLRLEAHVLADHLAREAGATDLEGVRLNKERKPHLSALQRIRHAFFEDLAQLRALGNTISELSAC